VSYIEAHALAISLRHPVWQSRGYRACYSTSLVCLLSHRVSPACPRHRD